MQIKTRARRDGILDAVQQTITTHIEPVSNGASLRDPRLIEGVLTNLMLFAGAAPSRIAALVGHCWVVPARRGDIVTRQGERVPGLFAIAYGQVKLTLRPPGHEERVVRIASAGQVFGEAATLLGQASRYEALALADSKLVLIPLTPLLALIDSERRFARSLIRLLAERNVELLREIESATLFDGTQRLASYLVSLVPPVNGSGACTVRLPVTKTLLAARLGVKKETLSRLLRTLAERGLISMTHRDITFLDPAGLAAGAG